MNIDDDVLKFLIDEYGIEKVVNKKCYKWSTENKNQPLHS